MVLHAVIMAGGYGERFWPASRRERPKQLLRLLGELTMLEETAARLRELVPPANIWVVTGRSHCDTVRELLPELPPENIIGEPAARNTAPCVALATALIRARDGENAVSIILPADHAIADADKFRAVLRDAAAAAAERPETLFTIGVAPTYPATGYGYIHCGAALDGAAGDTPMFAVRGFREKPDAATAEALLADGSYRWNSGIFIWKLTAIRREFARCAPEMARLEEHIFAAAQAGTLDADLPALYAGCTGISIDYAVMEKAGSIAMAECAFGWDDVGSWTALRNHLAPDADGNVASGDFTGVDASGVIAVAPPDHTIAALDVKDLIIVNTPDATLVASARSAQRIKELLRRFDAGGRKELL